ncbi:unnamed protein product [Protopolystoma xenopodis]|uniref:C2H2-type domain-containing protein n=1 Tax=Protopolystoma xenopodis TaxID=117903 RepID=A0A3S5A8Z2_9PLAT|nr:unnamed protein product [Protopolystoma xenopodis]
MVHPRADWLEAPSTGPAASRQAELPYLACKLSLSVLSRCLWLLLPSSRLNGPCPGWTLAISTTQTAQLTVPATGPSGLIDLVTFFAPVVVWPFSEMSEPVQMAGESIPYPSNEGELTRTDDRLAHSPDSVDALKEGLVAESLCQLKLDESEARSGGAEKSSASIGGLREESECSLDVSLSHPTTEFVEERKRKKPDPKASIDNVWNMMTVRVGYDITRKVSPNTLPVSGERSLVVDGFKFTKSRDGMGDRVFWRCSRRECKATAVTVSDRVEHVRSIHTHDPPLAGEFFAADSTDSHLQEVRLSGSPGNLLWHNCGNQSGVGTAALQRPSVIRNCSSAACTFGARFIGRTSKGPNHSSGPVVVLESEDAHKSAS